jgi:hypothetical protein
MKDKYYIVISKITDDAPNAVYCEWYEVKEEAELALEEFKEDFPKYSHFIYSAEKLNSQKEIEEI